MSDLKYPPPHQLTPEEVSRLMRKENTERTTAPGVAVYTGVSKITAARKEEGKWLQYIDILAAFTLTIISMIFNVKLFVSRAPNVLFDVLLMGALGAAFDLTKISLWVKGVRERSALYVTIALCFACISLLASVASTFNISSDAVQESETQGYAVTKLKNDIESLQSAIGIENKRLESGSVQFRTDANETRAARDKLMAEKDAKEKELASLLEAAPSAGKTLSRGLLPASLVSDKVNEQIEFWYLLVRGLLVEVGSLATLAVSTKKKEAVK